MNPPHKHHFVPAFYLSQWVGTDGLVCEHKRIAPGKIVDRKKHPNATGYQDNLYRVEGVPEEASQIVESNFMQVLDDQAAVALRMIVGGADVDWASCPRSAWTQFILSLRFRTPATVSLLKETMREIWEAATDQQRRESPPGLAPWSALSLLVNVIRSERIGPTIFGMPWGRLPLPHSSYRC